MDLTPILLELAKNNGVVIVLCLLLFGLALGPLAAFIFLVLQMKSTFLGGVKDLVASINGRVEDLVESINSVTATVAELKQEISYLPHDKPVTPPIGSVHKWRQ